MQCDASLTISVPILSARFAKVLKRFVAGGGFGVDWDEKPADLAALPPGIVTLRSRWLDYDSVPVLLKAAAECHCSVIVHAHYVENREGEVAGELFFYDALTRRRGCALATCIGGEPLVTLEDALSMSRAQLLRRNLLPVDLDRKAAAAWTGLKMTPAR